MTSGAEPIPPMTVAGPDRHGVELRYQVGAYQDYKYPGVKPPGLNTSSPATVGFASSSADRSRELANVCHTTCDSKTRRHVGECATSLRHFSALVTCGGHTLRDLANNNHPTDPFVNSSLIWDSWFINVDCWPQPPNLYKYLASVYNNLILSSTKYLSYFARAGSSVARQEYHHLSSFEQTRSTKDDSLLEECYLRDSENVVEDTLKSVSETPSSQVRIGLRVLTPSPSS